LTPIIILSFSFSDFETALAKVCKQYAGAPQETRGAKPATGR
jgi:hypothetical protein